MAQLDLTNIAASSISTPGTGVTSVFIDADRILKWKNDSTGGSQLVTGSIPIFSKNTADFVGTNVNTAQPWLQAANDTFTVSASTGYKFRGVFSMIRAAGVTSHTIGLLFGGTATFTNIGYLATSTSSTGNIITPESSIWIAVSTTIVVTAASIVATENNNITIEGFMNINGAGTIIPQFIFSAAPGGTPTIARNSFFSMIPCGSDTVGFAGLWS